jgi:hypothetical protein
MQSNRKLTDEVYRAKVEAARRMSPGEKLLEGARLFDEECRQRMEQLWKEYPLASEEDIRRLLRVEIDRQRREEEDGIYFPVEGVE